MFDLNIRLQLAAIAFLIIIAVKYYTGGKLPLLSTRCFSIMMAFACLNLFADAATVYTLSHIDTVSPYLNEVLHRVFFITLEALVFFLYLYVATLATKQKRFFGWRILFTLPFVAALVMSVFGEINYYNDGVHIYSYGTASIGIYACLAIYVVMIIMNAWKGRLRTDKRRSIIIGVSVWSIAGIIQGIFPYYLITGVAVVILMLFMYLSFENPREHLDIDVNCFNKRAFHLMLDEMASRKKDYFILNVVIDNMHYLNSKAGHETAYVMLSEVAAYIQRLCGARVYHSRGNTFSVILEQDRQTVIDIAHKIGSRFSDEWSGGSLSIMLEEHIDIIGCPEFCKTPDELFDLMNYLDETTLPVSDDRQIRVVDYELVKAKEHSATVEKIVRDAVYNDGFYVVFQPIFSIKDGYFASAEALVRLKDTTTAGYISPDVFITIAEKRGLIAELGNIVFEKVCKFASEHDLSKLGVHYIEVNLSGIQSVDPCIAEQLTRIIEKHGIEPDFINLEITETAVVESGYMMTSNMNKLRELGYSFSMDDFGTGYSNLSQMADVNYDLIKLDKSLITPSFEENGDKAKVVLETVITMVSKLNMKIVAEGVEREEEYLALKALGVDYIQGYYFSRPLDDGSYLQFLYKMNGVKNEQV